MKLRQGTVSVLIGCHSQVHSLVVLVAWIRLYHSLPKPWQLICILLHDIGHWGKDYLDDYEEKKKHSLLGSRVARRLFGQKGCDLVLGHNLYEDTSKSALHDPDKYSWIIAPLWWMVFIIWAEPKLLRKGTTRRETALMFKEAMSQNMKTGFKVLGHEIYLEQKREEENAEVSRGD